jgi:hypothetical protein
VIMGGDITFILRQEELWGGDGRMDPLIVFFFRGLRMWVSMI